MKIPAQSPPGKPFASDTAHDAEARAWVLRFASGEGSPEHERAFAAWLAERTALPMQYVRKKPKGFGRDARIEGDIHEGQRVLLVEDLMTDGGSKLSFIEAIRTAGAECAHTFVIFYYDIFRDTPQKLANEGVSLHYLTTWWDVLAASRELGALDSAMLEQVEAFLHDPRGWSTANGGA